MYMLKKLKNNTKKVQMFIKIFNFSSTSRRFLEWAYSVVVKAWQRSSSLSTLRCLAISARMSSRAVLRTAISRCNCAC